LFTQAKLRKIRLRSHLKNYLEANNAKSREGETMPRDSNMMPADCLHHVSVIDIVSGRPNGGYVNRTTGRLSLENSIPVPSSEDTPPPLYHAMRTDLSLKSGPPAQQSVRTPEEIAVSIFAAFLDGRFLKTSPGGQVLTKDQKQDYDQLIQRKDELRQHSGQPEAVNKDRERQHSELVKVLDDITKADEVRKARDRLRSDLVKVLNDSVSLIF
jgi:hypothetical protein